MYEIYYKNYYLGIHTSVISIIVFIKKIFIVNIVHNYQTILKCFRS